MQPDLGTQPSMIVPSAFLSFQGAVAAVGAGTNTASSVIVRKGPPRLIDGGRGTSMTATEESTVATIDNVNIDVNIDVNPSRVRRHN